MGLRVLKDESGNVIHACAVGSFPLPAGHWIYGKPVQPSAIDGDLPPDIRLKLRDALRYTLQVCTSRGKDDFDPDAVCMTFLNTLLGLEFRNDCETQGNAAEERFAMSDWKERVAKWAEDRNLVKGSSPVMQMNKLREEVQELSDALYRNHAAEICDAIGDIQVVLAVMCAQLGQDIDQCREIAWEQIKDRKGKMVNGVFVKEVQGE